MANSNITLIICFCFSLILSTSLDGGILVINGLSHEHNLQKGETATGLIVVKNTGLTQEAISTYQRDYYYNYKGEASYIPKGDFSRSNIDWLIINPVNFVIEPGEEVEITYEIRTPNLDTLKGTYWSVLMIEPSEDIDTSRTRLQLRIRSITRYAIQIMTHVNSDSILPVSKLEFLNIEIQKDDTISYLIVDLENTGEILMRTVMAVEIFSNSGESIGTFQSRKLSTYPTTSKRYVIELPALKTGNYQSLLVADSGKDEILGVPVTIEITDE